MALGWAIQPNTRSVAGSSVSRRASVAVGIPWHHCCSCTLCMLNKGSIRILIVNSEWSFLMRVLKTRNQFLNTWDRRNRFFFFAVQEGQEEHAQNNRRNWWEAKRTCGTLETSPMKWLIPLARPISVSALLAPD
jgi:hypothetical protein